MLLQIYIRPSLAPTQYDTYTTGLQQGYYKVVLRQIDYVGNACMVRLRSDLLQVPYGNDRSIYFAGNTNNTIETFREFHVTLGGSVSFKIEDAATNAEPAALVGCVLTFDVEPISGGRAA